MRWDRHMFISDGSDGTRVVVKWDMIQLISDWSERDASEVMVMVMVMISTETTNTDKEMVMLTV